jgi:hypothetical protein
VARIHPTIAEKKRVHAWKLQQLATGQKQKAVKL